MKDSFKNMFKNLNPMILVIGLLLIMNMINSNQSIGEWLFTQALFLPGIIIGLTCHEAAHAYASHWLGDPTPKIQRRLSLNPIRHMDPLGFVSLIFAGFGWGKPVEIDPRYYKKRRRDETLVALAGVTANLIIVVLCSFAIKALTSGGTAYIYGFKEIVFYVIFYAMCINIMLMIFNLLPVPPLDGFGIATQLFNLRQYSWYTTVYENGFYILLALIIFNVIDKILTPAMTFFIEILM